MKNDKFLRRTVTWVMMGLFFVVIGEVLNGQSNRTRREFDILGGLNTADLSRVVQPPGLALESTIDPEKYFVGPSDVFSANIWISPPLNFLLTVTPEGTLIIPTVGEVKVADITLADAKAKVVAKIRSKYVGGEEPTLTLVTPRPIVVIVTGNVLNPGSYVLASYYRANKAVEEANKPQVTQSQEDLRRVLRTMSSRNVRIKHKDGTSSHADITKFFATRDDRWNPYLREGDVIVVPRNDFVKNVIGVYGEVNVPGRYEYVRGDSVRDALRIAYGFTPLAIADSIEFTRLDTRAATISSRILNGRAILEGTELDFALEPGDRIVVRGKPDLRADYIAEIVGEVLYPGTYPITKNNTRLSEIIQRAGGVTEFASLKTAELLRRSVRPSEIELERLESLRGGVSPEDSAYYYLETNLRIRKEIVNVDFEKLILENDSTQDVILQNGDYIRVPSFRNTVYVFGQVVSSGHIPFLEGEEVDYYVRKAGGFTERARTSDLKVVKAKTRQWLSPEETIIEEGDYIWIPKDLERPFSYYMNIIGQTASIVSVAVSIVLLVIQVNK